MTAVTKPEETPSALAKRKVEADPAIAARVAENRERNAVVQAIRGTMWGKDLNETQVRAVAQYARENGIDPVRHVEVLGGRIYLTAELYDERGAALIAAGAIQPLAPDHIADDPRLKTLADAGDAWAKEEHTRRMRERIRHGVPEKAAAAVVTRFRITATGAEVVGVNWCGGGVRSRDPVGDAEPVKTALTRSRRRAWKQLVEIVPQLAAQHAPLKASAQIAEVQIIDAQVSAGEIARLPNGQSRYLDKGSPQVAAPSYGAGDDVPVSRPVTMEIPEDERDPYGLEGVE